MKIALAMMSLELGGGAEHDLVNLSTGLKAAGHEPLVITSGGRLCEDLHRGGVPVEIAPLNVRSPARLIANGARLADILRHANAEVLNPQGVYPAVSGRLATRRLARRGSIVPNVVTIPMLNRLTWWYYRLGAAGINYAADHVIVESRCELDRLRRAGMRREATILHNCFPPSRLETDGRPREAIRAAMGWPEEACVFLMPARMSPEKGHDVLLEALARAEAPRDGVLFFLAGDGPLLEAHRRAVRRAGLQDRVRFGGFRRDLPALYKAADVFLMCSRYESLPLSIREGMTASLPVLATDVGGIGEAVDHGDSGLLVPPEDPAALAEALAALARDADLRRRLGARGRRIIDERFHYEAWIRDTADLFDTLRARALAERG